MKDQTETSLLGRMAEYPQTYDSTVLRTIDRISQRKELGLLDTSFHGEDLWTSYEFSWIDASGKPQVRILEIRVPCLSRFTVESKSLKLYLNSYAQTMFSSVEEIKAALTDDLSAIIEARVTVKIYSIPDYSENQTDLMGDCLDDLEVETSDYLRSPGLLVTSKQSPGLIEEAVFTNLFRCLCPITGQPDWATIIVKYFGPSIERTALLKYLISYRNHQGFHESTIELIYSDLIQLQPNKISVFGCFLRRGGIDIRPFRSNYEDVPPYYRHVR